MRTKTTIALLAMLLIVLAFRPLPESVAARLRAFAERQPAAAGLSATSAPHVTPPAQAATSPGEPYVLHYDTSRPAAVAIGSTKFQDPTYALGLNLDSVGAGIDAVTLNQFRQIVSRPDPYVYQRPYDAFDPDVGRSLSLQSVALGSAGEPRLVTGNVAWVLRSATPDSARFEAYVTGPGATGPQGLALRISREYQLTSRAKTADTTQGYEVACVLRFKSYSDRPLVVQATMSGPTTPPSEQDRMPERQVIAGYDNHGIVQTGSHYVEEFTADKPPHDFLAEGKGLPILWFGTCSTYFDALVRLEPSQLSGEKAPTTAPASLDADYVGGLIAQALNPDAVSTQRQVQMVFSTKAMTLPPGETLSIPMRVFFGPKQRSLLNSDYYSAYPLGYAKTLQTSQSFCANCAPTVLINVLVMLLGAFHAVTRDWGLAIIGLVCLVRLLLHPITKRSQANMMRMGKMGPQINKLKEKYGDDKEALGKAQLEMMKQQGIGPLLGCLPLFLQAPIFISLFTCLQTTFELRHAPFLYGLTWIKDLAQPDRLIYFPTHGLDIWHYRLDAINLLPLLTGVVNFIVQKINQKNMPTAMSPEQQQQQKMMQWMTLLFPLIMYNLPSGLNLYYLASTAIGVFEAQAIRKHIKAQEAREAAERPTLIDVKPTRGSKLASRDATREQPTKRRGIAGWLAGLQQQAEDLRRNPDRRKPKP
jgi:YidC/Oxa1 family membrane protein insertase